MTQRDRTQRGRILAFIAAGTLGLAGWMLYLKELGEFAALLLVLREVIGVFRDEPVQRQIERMASQLHSSNPSRPEAEGVIERQGDNAFDLEGYQEERNGNAR